MKKIVFFIAMLLAIEFIASCNNGETYADQKKKENSAISKFIRDSNITVITESDFEAQNYTTDLSKNEFVLMKTSGVYMQIVREGCGEKIKNGETATVLCRFTEFNIMEDTLQLTNNILYFAAVVDKMNVVNNSGTFTGSFIEGESVMVAAYGSTSVPTGWLVPFTYIKVGRPESADEEIAKVNLIVPHDQGQIYATSSVYPCYYTITYERGR